VIATLEYKSINSPVKPAESTFHRFPDLAIELQIKIWEYAYPESFQPRTHCIKDVYVYKNGREHFHFQSNQRVSPLLHISPESRSFNNVLKDKTIPKIQKLALQTFGLDDLVSCNPKWPTNRHAWGRIRNRMRNLKGILTVFRDERYGEDIWATGRSLSFRDLSSREKRSGPGSAAVSYVRHCHKWNKEWDKDHEYRVKFRYVATRETEAA
jgi:hypothetical protein